MFNTTGYFNSIVSLKVKGKPDRTVTFTGLSITEVVEVQDAMSKVMSELLKIAKKESKHPSTVQGTVEGCICSLESTTQGGLLFASTVNTWPLMTDVTNNALWDLIQKEYKSLSASVKGKMK